MCSRLFACCPTPKYTQLHNTTVSYPYSTTATQRTFKYYYCESTPSFPFSPINPNFGFPKPVPSKYKKMILLYIGPGMSTASLVIIALVLLLILASFGFLAWSYLSRGWKKLRGKDSSSPNRNNPQED